MARLCSDSSRTLSGEICLTGRLSRTSITHPVKPPAGTTGILSPGNLGNAPAHGCVKNKKGQTG